MQTRRRPIPAQESFADLRFPTKGIDLTQGFGMQPSGTTPTGINVRAYEPGTARARGGQRPGITRYINAKVNGSNSIQELNYVIQTSGTIPGSSATLAGMYYATASTVNLNNNWSYPFSFTGGATTLAAVKDTESSFQSSNSTWYTIKSAAVVGSGVVTGSPAGATVTIVTDGTNFYLTVLDSATTKLTTVAYSPAGVQSYSNTNIGSAISLVARASVLITGTIYSIDSGGAAAGITQVVAATGLAGSPYILVSGTSINAQAYGNTRTLIAPSIAAVGSTMAVAVHKSQTFDPGVVFVTTAGSFTPAALLNLTPGGSTSNTPRIISDGTSFYLLVPGTSSTNGYVKKINTSGAVVWTSATFTGATSSYAIGYDSNANLVYVSNDAGVSLSLDPATGSSVGGGLGTNITAFFDAGTFVSAGQSAGGAGQTNYNRAIILIAVAGGQLRNAYKGTWHTPATYTGTLSSTVAVIRSTILRGKIYFADGTNYTYYDPVADSVLPWTATAGSLPRGPNGGFPRLIETWRGRIVLAGLYDDALNWFMSKVDDANNWDVSPLSVSPTQAIAGANGPQGQLKDVVTSLYAYSDDVLFMGGNNSLWKFQGDPMEGGRIDLVTDIIGVAFGKPMCKDPYGTLYFVSNRTGIYQIVPGQQPQRISQQIEQLLSTTQIDNVTIRMQWDDQLQGLHVYITHFDRAQAETHLFWEQRTGGWFQDTFTTNNHNPLCCVTFEGNTPADRVALIGSWDGYVRAWSMTGTTDDGVAIPSSVMMGPLLTPDLDDVLFKDAQSVLGTNGGAVTYSVFVGPSAEAALASAAVVTGTWTAGRNFDTPIRRAGHAIWVEITASNYWAMESIRLRIAAQGKVRRRGL